MQQTIRAASLAVGAFALAAFTSAAQAAWTLSNDNGGDGSLTGSFPVFQITGSNNGVGDNTTWYTQTFASATTFTFTWQYTSLDPGGTVWGTAGYLLGDTQNQLSLNAWPDVPSGGSVTVDIAAGQVFGFYVESADSSGGAGYLAINEDVTLPPPPSVPEPRAAVLMLAGLAALLAAVRRRRAARE